MTIKAGENIITESTPEQDDAAFTAAVRIRDMGNLMTRFKPGFRFMLDMEPIRQEIDRQLDFIDQAAKADRP